MTRFNVIGIAGGSGSGKTTFGRLLQSRFGNDVCAILSQDHYYIDQSARFRGDGENVNFDHPNALDFALLATHIALLRRGEPIQVPVYDFVSHRRKPEVERMEARPVILVDGTLILSQPSVVSCLTSSIFVDAPEEIRLERRLKRDMTERGRTREGVLKQFSRQVKPMHDLYVEPSKRRATHVVSGVEPFEPRIEEWCQLLYRK